MVSVDQALCIGCGVCVDMCAEIFALTDDGKVQVIKQGSETSNMEEIASACPVEAIQL